MRLALKLVLPASMLWLCHGSVDAQLARPVKADRAPVLLSLARGQALTDFALQHDDWPDPQPDCSHLVHQLFTEAGMDYAYARSRDLYRGVEEFERVRNPQPGDVIVWKGHVGIVVTPSEHTFFSSVRSGIISESWTNSYWLKRGHPRFYRYRIRPSIDLTFFPTQVN